MITRAYRVSTKELKPVACRCIIALESRTRSRFDMYGLVGLVLAYTISDFLLPGDLAIVLNIGTILDLDLSIMKREPRP